MSIGEPELVSRAEWISEQIDRQAKWDERWLKTAEYFSRWSKDPSTQTGAVIVDSKQRLVSVGYNGFPRGVDDSPERLNNRDIKLQLIVHCEVNAILFAPRSLEGCTLYTWPFMSCSRCAVQVIQAGIKRCVAPPIPENKAANWAKDMGVARALFREAGIQLDIIG
jgi:dCMP deaminase